MVLYPAGPFRSHGHAEQQLGQAFLLFPRNVKIFFENSSLPREKKEAAPPAPLLTRRGWLYTVQVHKSLCAPGPTLQQAHSTPGHLQPALTGLCTHRPLLLLLTLPCSSHGNCVLQAPPGSLSEPRPGPLCSSRSRAMVPGKMTTETFPNSPSTDGTLLNSFSCTQDSCLPYPTPSTEQLRHTQQTSSTSYFGGWTRARGQDTKKGAKYQESTMAPVILD